MEVANFCAAMDTLVDQDNSFMAQQQALIWPCYVSMGMYNTIGAKKCYHLLFYSMFTLRLSFIKCLYES